MRRHEGREHSSRQGHARHASRHAAHLRWREDHRALSHHRPGRARLPRGQDLQLSLRRRHGLQLHGARDLRADQRAQGDSGRRGRLPAGEHAGQLEPARGRAGLGRAAAARDVRDRRSRSGGEGADGVVVLQAGDPLQRPARDGAAAHQRRHPRRHHDRGRQLRGTRQGLSPARSGAEP